MNVPLSSSKLHEKQLRRSRSIVAIEARSLKVKMKVKMKVKYPGTGATSQVYKQSIEQEIQVGGNSLGALSELI